MSDSTSLHAPSHLAHDELRPGQREMIDAAYSALSVGGSHLAAAPTGIGKTAAALSAALDVARQSSEERVIFFLTGRQAQHRIVVETVRDINRRIRDGQRKVRLVDLVGQQGMCIDEIRLEHPALFSRLCAEKRASRNCMPYVRDSPNLRLKVLEDPLHVSELVEVARTHVENGRASPTCPWKIARECAPSADVVVCDYNHLFHERVREASLQAMGIKLENVIIIVDEAHNLPNRITQGMKRVLTADLVNSARMEVEEHLEVLEQKSSSGEDYDELSNEIQSFQALKAALQRTRNELLAWMRVQSQILLNEKQEEMRADKSELVTLLKSALSEDVTGAGLTLLTASRLLASVEVELDLEIEDEKETASQRLSELFELLNRLATHSALALVFTHGTGDAPRVTTHLLDPGIVSGPVFSDAAGSLLMSGTLMPPEMYSELLSIPTEREITMAQYASPFLADKRPVAIATRVTTQYTRRGESNTNLIRQHIDAVLGATPGHVAVFFPSYKLLEEIVGEHVWHGRRVLMEESGWSKKRIDSLLRDMELARSAGERILLAGVFAAKLAEGIDYERNLLDAVVCIGLPMAPPSEELNARKEYYTDRFGSSKAFRWAMQQPAVNSVLQAMGRPIRKMGDRAFILLLEDRLLLPRFGQLLPSDLNPVKSADPTATRRYVQRFFKRHPDPAIGTGE